MGVWFRLAADGEGLAYAKLTRHRPCIVTMDIGRARMVGSTFVCKTQSLVEGVDAETCRQLEANLNAQYGNVHMPVVGDDWVICEVNMRGDQLWSDMMQRLAPLATTFRSLRARFEGGYMELYMEAADANQAYPLLRSVLPVSADLRQLDELDDAPWRLLAKRLHTP